MSLLTKPAVLPMARFSTVLVDEEHRFESWRSLMGSGHEVEASAHGFSGHVRSVHLDRMLLHVMDASAQSVSRTQQRIRRDGLEHFVLHLNNFDTKAETPDGEVALLGGRVSVNDLARPSFRGSVPEKNSVILSLSRDLVAEAVGFTDGLHGLVLDSEAGLLLADHMRALAARADAIPVPAAASIARATAHLFAACVLERKGIAPRPLENNAALLRAKHFIERHLGSPELSPEDIARAAAMSRTTMFRLFQPLGGVSAYVLRRRLARIKACLTDPGEQRSLASLAYDHGFSSLSHFSRTFRQHYDCTPTDLRMMGADIALSTASAGQARHFADWIRGLG